MTEVAWRDRARLSPHPEEALPKVDYEEQAHDGTTGHQERREDVDPDAVIARRSDSREHDGLALPACQHAGKIPASLESRDHPQTPRMVRAQSDVAAEVVGTDAVAVAEIEPVSRLPVGTDAGVEMHLAAAESFCLLVQPCQQSARVSLLARRWQG